MTDQVMHGVVVSAKAQKTVVVEVSRVKKHPTYKKYIRVTKRYQAHDEENQLKEGDRVILVCTRPLSRWKHWLAKKTDV